MTPDNKYTAALEDLKELEICFDQFCKEVNRDWSAEARNKFINIRQRLTEPSKLEENIAADLPDKENTTEALTIEDYEECLADKRRLVREIDVIINGDKAAEQASLCDLIPDIEKLVNERNALSTFKADNIIIPKKDVPEGLVVAVLNVEKGHSAIEDFSRIFMKTAQLVAKQMEE